MFRVGAIVPSHRGKTCHVYSGGEYVGFNEEVYKSEKETAHRNCALAHYMMENGCFPSGTRVDDALDFYFQLCSIEVNAVSAAVLAATLANEG